MQIIMDLYTYRIVINKYVFAHLCLCYAEHCTNCQIVTLPLFLGRLSGRDRFIAIRFIASVIIFSILICFLYHILLWCTIMSQYYIHAWVFACVRVHMCVCWLPMEIKTLGIMIRVTVWYCHFLLLTFILQIFPETQGLF